MLRKHSNPGAVAVEVLFVGCSHNRLRRELSCCRCNDAVRLGQRMVWEVVGLHG